MAQSKPKKVSLDEVIHLVKQLPAEQQEQLRLRLNNDAEKFPGIDPKRLMVQRIDVDQLILEQGVPEDSLANLNGDFWPEDEDIDEFIATIRQWRKQG